MESYACSGVSIDQLSNHQLTIWTVSSTVRDTTINANYLQTGSTGDRYCFIISFSNNDKRGNSAQGQEHVGKKNCSEMPNKAKQVRGDMLTTIKET